MSQYYIVQVLTGRESKVKEIFLKCCMTKYCELNADIIIPRVNLAKKFQKTCRIVYKPVLPGYVILQCAKLTNELYYDIKGITGVTRVFRINIYYEEIKKFIISYQEKLTAFKKRMEVVRKRAAVKGELKILYNRFVRKKRVVKVNFPRKRGCLAICRMVRLLNWRHFLYSNILSCKV